MTRFFAGVLSVIAVGVLLIAYGLIRPGTAAYAPELYAPGAYPSTYAPNAYPAMFGPAGPGSYVPGNPYVTGAIQGVASGATVPMVIVPQQNGQPMAVPVAAAPAPQVVEVRSSAPRQIVRTTPGRPSRNWTRTALIIGGSTAAGAGIGGLIGGKKGALIGAAIGGGASSIQQATR
jgi:hypothetical protein